MNKCCPLEIFASIGGSAPSWAVRPPTCAMSTTTAMPTTTPRRMTGFARSRDSQDLPVASIGGSAPSWAVRPPTCAMSTTTAMPTTTPRRMTGFARSRDSQDLPDRADRSSERRAFEEGRGNHRARARKFAPRDGCRSLLAWRGIWHLPAFHGHPSSGFRVPHEAVRGASNELR